MAEKDEGAGVGLVLLSVWSGHGLIVAPLGASSVLLFAVPSGLGALNGLVLLHLFGQSPLVLAAAVALTVLVGQLLRCLHPPAGGMASAPGLQGRCPIHATGSETRLAGP